MKIVARLITFVIACVIAAIDTTLFYFTVQWAFSVHIGWALVAAVFWVQESTISLLIRQQLKEEGYL